MKIKELDAVLRLYEGNFRNLHWNAVGIDFNDSHKSISTEYYEMVSDTIDVVAEIICMLGENPCNYMEAIDILKASEKAFAVSMSNSPKSCFS